MQARKHSLLEACCGTAIGFTVAYISNLVILHAYGYQITLAESFWITCWFTAISVIRSYYVRRLFNYFHTKGIL